MWFVRTWRIWLALKLFPKRGGGVCGRRSWSTEEVGPFKITVTIEDLRKPDLYERTEVLGMLKKVRIAERLGSWTCPDPDAAEVEEAVGKMLADASAVGMEWTKS